MSLVGSTTMRVSGYDGLKFGHVVASIQIYNHEQTRLMTEMIRERAVREGWLGWEREY